MNCADGERTRRDPLQGGCFVCVIDIHLRIFTFQTGVFVFRSLFDSFSLKMRNPFPSFQNESKTRC